MPKRTLKPKKVKQRKLGFMKKMETSAGKNTLKRQRDKKHNKKK